MITIYPDFYPDFRCLASACTHTCCRDWEIDVDAESIERFKSLPDCDMILPHIETGEEPHIVLGEKGECPFLNGGGLCRIILAHGEDSVPYICREHPRFYNEYDSFTECGLGLSCEAVVSLLTADQCLGFIVEDEDEESPADEFAAYKYTLIRKIGKCENVFDLLREEIEAFGDDIPGLPECLEVFSALEYFTAEWPQMLSECKPDDFKIASGENRKLKLLAQYLLFRSLTSEDAGILLYVYASLTVISCMMNRSCNFENTVRLFSSEIEYSDCNISTAAEAFIS